jgi:low affinity Fe/Cu permease
MSTPERGIGRRLELLSESVTKSTGSSGAFGIALGIIVVWGLLGPVFHYSDTWQLVINTGTTIVTFLMVFLIQRSQNKEAMAVQLKLNELVASKTGASNRLIDVEDLTEGELRILHRHYQRLSEAAKKDEDLTQSHSIDEAASRQSRKTGTAEASRRAE